MRLKVVFFRRLEREKLLVMLERLTTKYDIVGLHILNEASGNGGIDKVTHVWDLWSLVIGLHINSRKSCLISCKYTDLDFWG